MFTKKSQRPRGRPRGRTTEGEASRARLFTTAVTLIGQRGYHATTLRDVAGQAQVSVGLLYRYFPNKRAVVLALYDQLSEEFAGRASRMPAGKWRDRFLYGLETSLQVLRPHRVTLRALVPVLVGDVEEGLFAERTAFSRRRVEEVFQRAVLEAVDAPTRKLADALGGLLYLVHLALILWWLLDKSPSQRATATLIVLIRRLLPSVSMALRLPVVRTFLLSADAVAQEALLE